MSKVVASGNPYIDAIIKNTKWDVTDFAFSFAVTPAQFDTSPANFVAYTPAMQAATKMALAQYAAVANVTFHLDTPDVAVKSGLLFGMDAGFGGGYRSGHYISTYFFNSDTAIPGTYRFHELLHEIGHYLGFSHASVSDVFGAMPADHDAYDYSVMASTGTLVGGSVQSDNHLQSLGQDDIRAIQYLYGANFTTHAEDTVYKWNALTGEESINGVKQGAPPTNTIFSVIWDGGGHDTYDLSNYTTNLKIDLQPGAWSTFSNLQTPRATPGTAATAQIPGNIGNAYLYNNDTHSLIEDVIGGSGHDSITGNQANNVLTGNAGNDTLIGLAGDDTLDGGAGADKLIGGDGSDTASYADAKGALLADLMKPSDNWGDATGDTYSSIENLLGGAYVDKLFGDNGANVITGGGGADYLMGRGGADTFVFQYLSDSLPNARDTIMDFGSGEDKVDLHLIDANTKLDGDQSFTYIGAKDFTGHAGELNFVKGVLSADFDGDGKADFQVTFVGHGATLLASEIIL